MLFGAMIHTIECFSHYFELQHVGFVHRVTLYGFVAMCDLLYMRC